jgi:predicted PurR-regulated permease PerM
VDYREKIAQLKAKGVLSDDDTKMLDKKLSSNHDIEFKHTKNRYFVLGGIVLFVVVLFVFVFISVGSDSINEVENVSNTINSITSGINSSSSVLVYLCLFLVGGYLFLYFISYTKLNYFKNQYTQIELLDKKITNYNILLQELSQKLEEYAKIKDDDTNTLVIKSKSKIDVLMQSYQELQTEIVNLKNLLEQKKMSYKQNRQNISYKLAKLLGEIPKI